MDTNLAAATEQHRAFLLKLARLRLGDDDAAHDAVQDTLEAALRSHQRFSGRSSLRTWLVGILRHKIGDLLRHRRIAPVLLSALQRELALEEVERLFDRDGRWLSPPSPWDEPDLAATQQAFFDVLEQCLARLPAATGRVFVMREVMEMTTTEICAELALTANHLGVLLYRARMSLRECLSRRWFGGREA